MNRWKAAAVHAMLSLLVIGSIAVGVVLLWFPAGLWHVAGLQLFGVMLAANIVLGPLLTLLVFRKGKRGMTFDLWAISLVQAAFVAYGVHTLWLNRPLFLVGSEHSFALVFASEIPAAEIHEAEARNWPRFHGRGPWLVGVDLSRQAAMEEAAFAFAMGGGGPLRESSRYVDYDEIAGAVLRKAQPVPERLVTSEPKSRLRAAALVSIRTEPSIVLLDATDGKPLRVSR